MIRWIVKSKNQIHFEALSGLVSELYNMGANNTNAHLGIYNDEQLCEATKHVLQAYKIMDNALFEDPDELAFHALEDYYDELEGGIEDHVEDPSMASLDLTEGVDFIKSLL